MLLSMGRGTMGVWQDLLRVIGRDGGREFFAKRPSREGTLFVCPATCDPAGQPLPPEDPPTTWRLTSRRKHLSERKENGSQVNQSNSRLCLLSQLLSSCLTSKKAEKSIIRRVRVVGSTSSFLPPSRA